MPKENNFLEKQDLEKLLKAPLEIKEIRIIQLRDKVILELLYSTGLKVTELANLQKEQIDLKNQQITITGKGNKSRTISLTNQTQHWLKKYLEAKKDESPSLFLRQDRAKDKDNQKNLTTRSIQRLLKKYTKLAGIVKKVTPHTLRQNFAFDLLNKGTDIKTIQKIMGHTSINTTKRYLKPPTID